MADAAVTAIEENEIDEIGWWKKNILGRIWGNSL